MTNQESPIFRVLPRQVDTTLAAALREWLPGRSWSQVRGLLKSRRVMLSGNVCVDPARRLRLSDVVRILPRAAPPPPREEDVRVRYLDRHVVVVEKPAGVTTTRHREERRRPGTARWRGMAAAHTPHRRLRRRQLQPTLDELLPQIIVKMEKQKRRKGTSPPVRAVHRLDRDTSGLVVFARTAAAEQHLIQQFRKHTTHRRYLAIVRGHLKAQTIASRLVRDRGDGRRGSTTLPDVGKQAVTHVRPIERFGEYTLIECRLETGRTHQIRIHLAERGSPVCGDKLYNQPLFGKAIPDTSGAPRLALHAAELGLEHPITGQPMRFEMPLPRDLAAFVKQLRDQAKS